MKKKVVFFMLALITSFVFSQEKSINFSIIGLGWELPFFTHVGKIGDNIFLCRNMKNQDYFERKTIEDCILQIDGFYVLSIFGNQTVVLLGGNYFVIP